MHAGSSALPAEAFIEVDVAVVGTADGGRQSGIWSGYRPSCWIGHVEEGRRTYNDATFYVLDADVIQPGDTGRACVRPHFPEFWTHLAVGDRIEICEGPRVVAHAVIIRLRPNVL